MPLKDIELKKTVNLPRTDFPMKANLPQAEPKLLERWEKMDLYGKIRQARAGRPLWVLHDGPPYANGNIHLGTAFNKILKDFIVKSRSMAGFDAPYVPGWDCHGLPIENKVDGELGARKAQMTPAEIREECRRYAQKFVELHRREFKRLGVFGQWDRPYLTMTAEYEAVIAQAFVDFLDRGYVYKGLRPVHWCMRDRTALAEAEVEYENHSSPSIWVRFAMTSDPGSIDPALADRKVYGLIWTTTPWTIPANMAIAFHPKFRYVAVAEREEVYIVAEELWKATAERCGWPDAKVVTGFPGAALEGAVFRHPLIERDSVGILAEHVTLDQGTGAVHTAPGHGQEDYAVGKQYGIPVFCPVDAGGRFFHAEGAAGRLPEEIIGKTVWEANPVVVDLLRQAGALLAEAHVEHSYPHCWRCHKPTIFRATEQWFIGRAHTGLRDKALEAVKSVRWIPGWGEERMSGMVGGRPDWCISRQRVWGVPIVVFYCEDCGEPFTERKRLDRVVDLFRQHTTDVWYERTEEELLGEGARCAKCGGSRFRKGTDILDVWFDSGSSHLGRVERSRPPSLALRFVCGGAGSVPRLVPELAAGGRRAEGRRALPAVRHPWLDAGWGRPGDVEVDRQHHRAGDDRQAVRGRGAAAMGGLAGVHRRRAHLGHDPGASLGGLPQAAQHVPLRARQSERFRPGLGRGGGRRDGGDRPVDSDPRRESGEAVPGVV
jgi:isoleucyl-tRNA synthetase